MTLSHGEIAYTYDALGNKWFKYVGESNGQAGDEKHGTAYLFGFQYSFKYNEVVEYDWKLMHIATSEGYVSAVYPEGIGGNFKLHYVYNHTDHLGNIRQNITRKGNEIEILKEDNYYPFGLTHRVYNEQKEELKYDPEQDRIFTIQAQASRYKYLFQGQERQTDIDLNWDSFKYRNYDYAIGRFFNVDPLAEKFPYNGMYNFSENRVVDSGELEGLESVIKIYGQNNEPTVLQSNNYSSMEWTNVQRAYFSMAKSIKNGTGNWNAYASRNTPPEHGTLNLYYGNNGIEKASFQTPGWSERFANSFSKGQRAFYTIFIKSDPHVEGSKASVEFTNHVFTGALALMSFEGGVAALAGNVSRANMLLRMKSIIEFGKSQTEGLLHLANGNNAEGYQTMLQGGVSYFSGNLFNKAINFDPNFSSAQKVGLQLLVADPHSQLIGLSTGVLFDLKNSQQQGKLNNQQNDKEK